MLKPPIDINHTFSFPYAWSNPNIREEVLLYKIVDYGFFKDIALACRLYGADKVEAAAERCIANHPISERPLRRMLANIRSAIAKGPL